jgi:hypothetical protein
MSAALPVPPLIFIPFTIAVEIAIGVESHGLPPVQSRPYVVGPVVAASSTIVIGVVAPFAAKTASVIVLYGQAAEPFPRSGFESTPVGDTCSSPAVGAGHPHACSVRLHFVSFGSAAHAVSSQQFVSPIREKHVPALVSVAQHVAPVSVQPVGVPIGLQLPI